MSIINKIARQSLKKNKSRTVVTIIGVVLSVALMTAISTTVVSFQSFMIDASIAEEGEWHLEFYDVDRAFIDEVSLDPDASLVATTQTVEQYELEDDELVLTVQAYSPEAFSAIPLTLSEGRLPENKNEIVLPQGFWNAEGNSYQLEDIFVGSAGDYTVVGFSEKIIAVAPSSLGFNAVTAADPSSSPGDIFNARVALKDISQVFEFGERYSEQASVGYNSDLLRYQGLSENDNFMTVFYGLATILILLIGIGSVLLIYNSFSISVNERVKQFGILASVGATHKQLARSVLHEGFYVGVIGIPVGLILGLIGTGITLEFSKELFSSLLASGTTMKLVVAWEPLVISLVVGVLTIFISAYIPARRAARLSAIDAIRQNTEIVVREKDVRTSKFSRRLLGLEGTLALKNSKRNRRRYRATVISLVVSIVLFISASSYGAFLHAGRDTAITDVGYDLSLYAGPQDEDEAQELFDKLRVVEGVDSSAWIRSFYGATPLPDTVLSERFLESLEVESGHNASSLAGQKQEYGVNVYTVDDQTFTEHLAMLGLSSQEYLRADNPKIIAMQKLNHFNFDEQRYESFDMFKTADPITLDLEIFGVLPREEKVGLTLEITQFVDSLPEVFSQTHNIELIVLLPYSVAKTIDGGAAAEVLERVNPQFFFTTESPSETSVAMINILESYGLSSSNLIDANALFEGNRNLLLIIDIFVYSFIILTSLVTIANVFNTISTSINLRRREFAMLQSVGMTQKSFRRMLRYESAFYGIKALVIGLIAATLVSYAIYRTVMTGADVVFTLPWASVGIGILGVFVVVFTTMQYSVSKLNKVSTIDALRTETF